MLTAQYKYDSELPHTDLNDLNFLITNSGQVQQSVNDWVCQDRFKKNLLIVLEYY